MSIKTSRAEGTAEVIIDHEKCNLCGSCVTICKSFVLSIEKEKLMIDQEKLFGCIACGHCVAVCNRDAIEVKGRDMEMSDFYPLPGKESKAGYEQLMALLQSRRSIRDFRDKEISQDILDKILAAASTAPMGVPPTDVRVLVLHGRPRVHEFVTDFLDFFASIKWMFSPVMLQIYRPFISKETYSLFKTFLTPLADFFINGHKEGKDWVLYDAPLAIYFYGSPYADPVDPDIPATYAMIAAESLGLGTCMIGRSPPLSDKAPENSRKNTG